MATKDHSHPSITKELLERALRHDAKEDHVTVESFEVKQGSSHGDNFACVVYAVRVDATTNGEQKVYNFMIKCLPENDLRKAWINNMNIFEREAKVYTELIPDMLVFQKDAGKETLVPSIPKCYYGFSDGKNDALVLENLKFVGYKMADRMKGVDYDHCKLVMTELAKFHAISFAMKQKFTKPLMQIYPFIRETFLSDNMDTILEFWENGYKDVIQLTANNPDYCQYAEKMEKYSGCVIDNLKKLLEPNEPFSVICHGDCWCNNMLFSYEEKEGENVPVSVQLVDLQLSRYAPPTTDLAYFFYTSTTPSLRKNRLEDLLKLYHETFLDCTKHLGAEASTYTFEKLRQSFRDSLPYGYFMACLILPPILSDPKSIPEFDTIAKENMDEFIKEWKKLVEEQAKSNVPMKERIFGMIAEMAAEGVI